jgi:hypothetical protein
MLQVLKLQPERFFRTQMLVGRQDYRRLADMWADAAPSVPDSSTPFGVNFYIIVLFHRT